jgi:phospholipid transport system substrate-binding protein
LGTLICLFWSVQSADAQPKDSPELMVQRISQDILDEIKADRSLQSGDISRLNDLVDRKVMPYVNFQRMTALSVGRNWRQASPEQQRLLMNEFRTLLLLTYADAVRQVTDLTFKIAPVRMRPEDQQVVVRTTVLRPGKEAIQLDYRLEKTADSWKIFDFNILGLWLIEHYRTQFNQIVSAEGIDGLIRSLREKNEALSHTKTLRKATS